jgi:hypothetical protein
MHVFELLSDLQLKNLKGPNKANVVPPPPSFRHYWLGQDWLNRSGAIIYNLSP